MDKKQKEYIIASILILAFIILLVHTIISRKSKRKEQEIPTKTEAEKPTITSKKTTKVFMIDPKRLSWGRDPFAKVRKAVIGTEVAPFRLSAIIWDEEKPHAIINEEIVVVGQKIAGYDVIEIDANSAVLKKGAKKIKLELYE